MNSELKGSRLIHLSGHDLEMARQKGKNINVYTRVRERNIAIFCKPCDQLKTNNTCEWIESNEQAARTVIENCDLASINGVSGRMTGEGFTPEVKRNFMADFLKKLRS